MRREKSHKDFTDCALQCYSVTVLQFQNQFVNSRNLTLYLYINIEVFLWVGNAFREL